ncbi:hypothetical protein FO440_09645 [Mucilaginibacter corticis]|uniref:Uncharacterized protein n=1 Tax=Mucilaginibacter corticis TaxID=2597670 RepID=A0A556MWW8_9SPHI|nr:hypothetical protein [Mucilaginibacter corticis]TSJ44420.1 hypothetical protein FO440_09645 [Mucilaginibacter corticis]
MESEELHSFAFCEAISGVEHAYRITEQADHVFGVEKDGVLIAELSFDSVWKQLSGNPLENQLFQKICDRIEDHYAQ